jgi:hypothetical protein
MSDFAQRPSQEELMRRRLVLLDAYELAAKRRADVMDAVGNARDCDEARRSLASLLGVTEEAASLVLRMPLSRFSRRDVERDRAEGEAIRGHLDQGR